ncbi:MAG: protease modulator HflC [Chloroflexota bacterium]|nr:protease modulator HflC [Chloroflexota bacterium]MDE2684463.1 protease modulator HflC [Chloroflexota bacterium]
MRNLIIIAIVIIVALVLLRQSLYVVDVTEQVIILRFGEVVKTRLAPGLDVKVPFVDTVVRLDKRILRIDAPPVSMPDTNKQNLVIDIYARYRITDPVQFRKTLQTETNARSRLGDIVTSTLRDRVAQREREEIIGAELLRDPDTGAPIVEDDVPLVEPRETRTEILDEVLAEVRNITVRDQFGIEMIDVRIKRADFPEAVTASIYTRMRAERNRIAAGFRAEGEEQDRRIRADTDRQRDVILAAAEQQSNEIRGQGEAEAISILADALNRDPELFAFLRSLEAYQRIIRGQDTIILSSDSPLFDYLASPNAPEGSQ